MPVFRTPCHQAARLRAAEANVTANACHPGVVTSTLLSGLGFNRGWDSAGKGAATPAHLALSPKVEGVSGQYFEGCSAKGCQWQRDTRASSALLEACGRMLGWP